jgi:beta-lactamase regulating signal transducer with metallopeptidase domain
MWVWMDRIGLILFDAALSTALLLTLIVLAMLGCRQPVRRILLARVALLASLAIPPLVGFGRLPRLDVIDGFVESRLFPWAVRLMATGTAEEPVSPTAGRRVTGPEEGHTASRWVSDLVPAARRWLPRGLTVLDLACVAGGSAWLLLGLVGVQWLIYRSKPPSPTAQALFDELVAKRPGGAARTRLRLCSRLPHPVVTGLFRPTILLPESLDRADPDVEPLRLSLLHEIAHAERSDHWFSTAASVAQAVWFFLPQVWWIRSQLLIDQEFLADRSAAAQYGTSSEYASSLLSLAAPGGPHAGASTNDESRVGSSTGTVGVQSPLVQRMMMLLHCPYPVESRTPRVWSWTYRIGVVLASVAAACLMVRWPQKSLANPVPGAEARMRHRFELAHFVAEPLHDGGSPLPTRGYMMPIALPPRFDLEFDFRCEVMGPVAFRLAGKAITVPGVLDASPSEPGSSSPNPKVGPSIWHHVALRRDHRHLAVFVDGRPAPETTPDTTLTTWLTVEPPFGSRMEIRKLTLQW